MMEKLKIEKNVMNEKSSAQFFKSKNLPAQRAGFG